ncbi:hypothetical protein N431DRAFT_482178 [Stipitochalara longipes BDJ]|nr:hypothetical protein N431DRAFT_482178 [Stipitochalara longipes BDJ]
MENTQNGTENGTGPDQKSLTSKVELPDDSGSRSRHAQERPLGSAPNITVPLAWYEAVNARITSLENVVATLPLGHQQRPVTNFDIPNETFVSSPTLNGNNANAEGDHNVNHHPGMRPGAGNPTIAHELHDDLDSILFNPLASPENATGMNQAANNDGWETLLGLNPSTSPSTQSSDFDFDSPMGLGDTVDNPSPASGTFGSALVATPSRSTHNCTGCMRSFARAYDLRRHALIHNANAPRLSCPRAGCGRQFLRSDKLKDHRARKGH